MILHIVTFDKFTCGYINFMKTNMCNFEHYFIVSSKAKSLRFINSKNIYYIENFYYAIKNKEIQSLLDLASMIIASGLFETTKFISMLKHRHFNKLNIQLWGGDFYFLQDKIDRFDIVGRLVKYRHLRCISKANSIIFLIDGDYKKFQEITRMKKKHFVAPMPFDPINKIDIAAFRGKVSNRNSINIMVGNSATTSNQHVAVFSLLSKYTNEDFEVFVPLSYGDEKYKNIVIQKGIEILGTHFHPIVSYLNSDVYTDFLSSIEIAIFNNNRQQGMGNILTLLGLGKKVYLRNDTSMWEEYTGKGYDINSVDDIARQDYKDFIEFPSDSRKKNIVLYNKFMTGENEKAAWDRVFTSIKWGKGI